MQTLQPSLPPSQQHQQQQQTVPASQPRPLIAEIEQLKRSVDSMNTQTADVLKHLDHLRQIGVDHVALPSTEQEKLDREWEYFETVCDQVFFILENTKYKMERQRLVLLDRLNTPAVTVERSTGTVIAELAVPAATPLLDEATDLAPKSLMSTTSQENQKTAPEDLANSGDVLMLSPNPHPTTSHAGQTNSNSPTASADLPNACSNEQNQAPSPLPYPAVAASSTITPSATSAITPAGILQSTGELTPGLLTIDGTMGMDTSLITDLDKFQDSMLDLGDIGNLGDMDGGMGVDFYRSSTQK